MRGSKGMTTIGASVLAVTLGMGTLGSVAVYRGGAIRVHVVEKRDGGKKLRLFVPGVVVPVALWAAPDKQLARAMEQAKPFLPALAALGRGLEDCPDAVFVEVDNAWEKVRVEKRGDAILVNVVSEREDVRVSLPIYVIRSLAEKLEATSPTQ